MPFDELAGFRDLVGELPSTTTEFTTLSLNIDDGDIDALFVKALDGNIFGETGITDLLVQLVRRWFGDALQCCSPSKVD
jgi:hypothetical protein